MSVAWYWPDAADDGGLVGPVARVQGRHRGGEAPPRPRKLPRHALDIPPDADAARLATEQDRRDGRTRAAETKRQQERELVEVAVPAILADLLSSLPDLLHVVRLCDHCRSQHFLPAPVFPGVPCMQIECQCWCSEGTGQ